jgi:hypothetical protein
MKVLEAGERRVAVHALNQMPETNSQARMLLK